MGWDANENLKATLQVNSWDHEEVFFSFYFLDIEEGGDETWDSKEDKNFV